MEVKRPVSMEENLAVMMMRVRSNVRAAMREVVQEEGMTQNEIEVLLLLQRGAFDTARDISQELGMPRSLVSKAVDQLVRRGYVEAVPDREDRRVVRLRLLPSAGERIERLARARKEFFVRLCQGVTEEEASAFCSMVGKMKKNLDGLQAVPETGRRASL